MPKREGERYEEYCQDPYHFAMPLCQNYLDLIKSMYLFCSICMALTLMTQGSIP